jgi:hypothetical protein
MLEYVEEVVDVTGAFGVLVEEAALGEGFGGAALTVVVDVAGLEVPAELGVTLVVTVTLPLGFEVVATDLLRFSTDMLLGSLGLAG